MVFICAGDLVTCAIWLAWRCRAPIGAITTLTKAKQQASHLAGSLHACAQSTANKGAPLWSDEFNFLEPLDVIHREPTLGKVWCLNVMTICPLHTGLVLRWQMTGELVIMALHRAAIFLSV